MSAHLRYEERSANTGVVELPCGLTLMVQRHRGLCSYWLFGEVAGVIGFSGGIGQA